MKVEILSLSWGANKTQTTASCCSTFQENIKTGYSIVGVAAYTEGFYAKMKYLALYKFVQI